MVATLIWVALGALVVAIVIHIWRGWDPQDGED